MYYIEKISLNRLTTDYLIIQFCLIIYGLIHGVLHKLPRCLQILFSALYNNSTNNQFDTRLRTVSLYRRYT